jgi:hypothetical protein
MYVPGVKQEQPDRRRPLQEPVMIDMTIRDANHVRIVRVDEKRPEDVVRILNSILQKMNSTQKVIIVEDNRVLETRVRDTIQEG